MGADRQERSFYTCTNLNPQTHVGSTLKIQVQSFTLKVSSLRMDVPGFRIEILGRRIAAPIFVMKMPAPQPHLKLVSACKVVPIFKLKAHWWPYLELVGDTTDI